MLGLPNGPGTPLAVGRPRGTWHGVAEFAYKASNVRKVTEPYELP